MNRPALPDYLTVLQRDWLSANNIVFIGPDEAAVVDTGYYSHADQTVALVANALQGRPLQRILNTHLHSDHCGGNAALQQAWPQARIAIPPGQWQQVEQWDAYALSYTPTDQHCPRFRADERLHPGHSVRLGNADWQILASPGHDPHSVLLFEPEWRVLISADALWERGIGVVFPELDGESAFDEAAATLDLIEQLAPAVVIPGHGAVFTDVAAALATARKRVADFASQPARHARYAAKSLLMFKLLEWRQIDLESLCTWVTTTPYFRTLHERFFPGQSAQAWALELAEDLLRSGTARREGDTISSN